MGRVVAALAALASAPTFSQGQPCVDRVTPPSYAPPTTHHYNGVELTDVCINEQGVHIVYALGDWGGVLYKNNQYLMPADRRSKLFPAFRRKFQWGVDEKAQQRVAAAMKQRALMKKPDFILNLGDMFYWTGIKGNCANPPVMDIMSVQFTKIFEEIYNENLADIPFLGVLGNHDYGGYKFTAAWGETIGYTWGGNMPRIKRWILPALYYSQRVRYPDFSTEWFFIDTNAADASGPGDNNGMNLCGSIHNGWGASCGHQGPPSLQTCHAWFWTLWSLQWDWLVHGLARAQRSTYQIIVAHHPPTWFTRFWNCLADRFGIDLFVGGHTHYNIIYGPNGGANPIKGGSCTIVSGGGGGITSEGTPDVNGNDDMYGFVEIQQSRDHIVLGAISHGGIVRNVVKCYPRQQNPGAECSALHNNNPLARRLEEVNGTDIANQFI